MSNTRFKYRGLSESVQITDLQLIENLDYQAKGPVPAS